MMAMTSTRTRVFYFGQEDVDRLVGGAYKELAEEFELRKPHMPAEAARAGEARLELLRNVWLLMLEPVP